MNTHLLKHRLIPDGKVPSDPEGLVRILQRAIPHELFDPDEHAMETTVSYNKSVLRGVLLSRFVPSSRYVSLLEMDPISSLSGQKRALCSVHFQIVFGWRAKCASIFGRERGEPGVHLFDM